MTVRIATFNVENLMARFDFSGWGRSGRRDRVMELHDIRSKEQFKTLEQARVIAHSDDTRQMTALAIADTRADIVCLQEVENDEALAAFEGHYLGRMFGLDYSQQVWKQGNDGRGIDVALMARERTATGERIEIVSVRSHRNLTFGALRLMTPQLKKLGIEANERIFRRDLLEVDLRIGGRMATIFVTHLKSMGPWRDGVEGRTHTKPVRDAEVQAILHVLAGKFDGRQDRMRWLLCGDMNDYNERLRVHGSRWSEREYRYEAAGGSALDGLFEAGENLVARRPQDDRWTLFHASGPPPDNGAHGERATQHLVQLDYIIASPALSERNAGAVPEIVRHGMAHRVPFPPHQDVERYPRMGWDRPKASDHCPVVVELEV